MTDDKKKHTIEKQFGLDTYDNPKENPEKPVPQETNDDAGRGRSPSNSTNNQ